MKTSFSIFTVALLLSFAAVTGVLGHWHHSVKNTEGDHPLALSAWNGYCGKERAAVKHTVDGAASLIPLLPIRTTIPKLVALPVPSSVTGPDSARAVPEESHIYKITGTLLTLVKSESDGDLHMVLRSTIDPSKTMIVESIPSSCAAGSPFINQITSARSTVLALENSLPHKITITGIGYFDFIHGQTGVAPNGIELHPVLSVQ